MMSLVVYVTGLLLVVLASSCAAQNSTSTPQPDGGSFTFDCRRDSGSGSCANNTTCNLNSGRCDCGGIINTNYKCQPRIDTGTCNPPCANGFCNGGKCSCDESYYGLDCSLNRVQVFCEDKAILVNINPMDNFDGLIYVQNKPTCRLTLNSTGLGTSVFNILPGMQGWSIILPSSDANCTGAMISTPDNSPSAKIYVQYNSMFKSSVDQIVTAKCTSNSNMTVSSGFNVTDYDNGVHQIDGDGKADAVKLQVFGPGGSALKVPVLLGDEIHLVFSMTVVDGSANNNFKLLICSANNTLQGAASKTIDIITAGCPEQNAKPLFSGLPKYTSSGTLVTIDIGLKAFMFIGSSSVAFTCTVGFCNGTTPGCGQTSCPGYSDSAVTNPAPSNNGQPTTTSTITPNTSLTSPPRRKRDAEGRDIGAVVKVRDPNDNSTIEEVTEKPPPSDDCINNQDIIAIIAVLGVCVFMLVITSVMLLLCMMKSKKKTDSGQLDRFPRPVETMRFPRLEMHAAHNGGC